MCVSSTTIRMFLFINCVGPEKLDKHAKTSKNRNVPVNQMLMERMCKYLKCTMAVSHVYVNAIVCEPSNDVRLRTSHEI